MSDRQQPDEWRQAIHQKQFLDVISRDEAAQRFSDALPVFRPESETVDLHSALDRVLASDIVSPIDVPAFDRSNVDGFAVQSADTTGAREEAPCRLSINDEVLSPGVAPAQIVNPGTATPIATGGMLPRGSDAVVMIEHTEAVTDHSGSMTLQIDRSAASGQAVTFAGTDIARGEHVLRAGQLVTSREVGVLAALGFSGVAVRVRPRVAVISTGNEIVAPGDELPLGSVYDSNAAILCGAIYEAGCEPVPLGTVRDDVDRLRDIMTRALDCDAVLLSGGTSKGAGDLSYQVVSEFDDPGIVAHGVALKPGKPICLAVTQGKPVVVLPGFPTSAIFTFHEFVAPVLKEMAGRSRESRRSVKATLPIRVNSDRGRTEYLLVGLVPGESGFAAWPMGKGSGSVTTFSQADGFVTIDQHAEMLDEGSKVQVTLIDEQLKPADLVVIGSHCVGLDFLLGELRQQGITSRVLHVGSMGGVTAARRGECDIAGVHLLDATSGRYNEHLVTDDLLIHTGYRRKQGIVFRADDERFQVATADEAVRVALRDDTCRLVNRNAGSGTRVLIDRLLGDHRPAGYNVQTKSHNAVATAIAQQRADWGVAINTVAESYGLAFLPLQDEHYDFLIPACRAEREPVRQFRQLLARPDVIRQLADMGFERESRISSDV